MTGAYVGRWHADDGFRTVIVEPVARPKGGRLRVVVPGYPVVLRTLPATEARHITPLDIPVRRAARQLRAMAVRNAGKAARRFLDRLVRT